MLSWYFDLKNNLRFQRHELLKQKWCRLVCDLLLGETFPHYSSSGIHKKDRKLWIASGFNLFPMILKSQLSLNQSILSKYLSAIFKEHSLCLLRFYSNIEWSVLYADRTLFEKMRGKYNRYLNGCVWCVVRFLTMNHSSNKLFCYVHCTSKLRDWWPA